MRCDRTAEFPAFPVPNGQQTDIAEHRGKPPLDHTGSGMAFLAPDGRSGSAGSGPPRPSPAAACERARSRRRARVGSVQRLGGCGGGDMTGRAVFGWGIVDGLGVAAGTAHETLRRYTFRV